jgi:hypothetical protein
MNWALLLLVTCTACADPQLPVWPLPSLHAPAHVCPAEHVAGPHGGHALRHALLQLLQLAAPQNVAVEGVDPDSALELMLVSVEGMAMGPVRKTAFLNAFPPMPVTALPMTNEASVEP